MAITFPADCTTDADKLEYCQRAEELMRQMFNVMGAWSRGPLSEATYQQLPAQLKAAYSQPRDVKLPATAFQAFRTYFKARQIALLAESATFQDFAVNGINDPVELVRDSIRDANYQSARWSDDIFKAAL